jgi:hypothetical protein
MEPNTSKEFTDSFLNEIERAEIEKLCDNRVLYGAVKKLLLSGAYYNGVLQPGDTPNSLRNFALQLAATRREVSNEQLGADLRASSEAVMMVESGFQRIDAYKRISKVKEPIKNKAH